MLSLSRVARALLPLVIVAGVAACSRNDPAAFVASAKSYIEKSDYKAAVIQLKNAIEKAPDDGEARFLLAKTLLDTGDPVGAETEVRKAIDRKYPQDETYPLLVRALVGQGKYQAAIAEVPQKSLKRRRRVQMPARRSPLRRVRSETARKQRHRSTRF